MTAPRNRWLDPEYRRATRDRYYRARFGITEEQFLSMLEEQEGVCGICGGPETDKIKGKAKRLAIDHDHETGEVRGLLCSKCNRAIGLLEDNVDRLHAAIRWLS